MLTANEWQEAVETWQMIAQRDADQLARSREILAICQERLRLAREREAPLQPTGGSSDGGGSTTCEHANH